MRPLRDRDPEIYHLITLRTVEARLWITPCRRVRRLIGGVVARYQEIFGIIIFAGEFLGNHYHLLIKAPNGNADEFCENINREIAKRLNKLHGREGKFWSRRYDDQQVLSYDDLLEAFLYITTNATRHGLIEDPALWPGLNSYRQSVTGEAEVYSFERYIPGKGTVISTHTLTISPLPQHQNLSSKKRLRIIRRLLIERTKALIAGRKGKFANISHLRRQVPGARPKSVSRSPRPPCYTFDSALRLQFRKLRLHRRKLYDEASIRYRLGQRNVMFPEYTFKPPTHRLPRSKPFTPLKPTDLFAAA